MKADSSFYMCDKGKWDNDFSGDNFTVEIPIVESKDDLGECNEENDGEMFRVPRDTIYDTYACENGEWISDFGGNDATVDPNTVVKGTFKDERDGKTYKTVKIGHQTWMAENLNYKVDGSYCYDNKTENCKKYGRLYSSQAAKQACPDGWKVPTKKSWEILLATTVDFSLIGTPEATQDYDPFMAIKFESFMGLNNDPYGFNILPTGRGDGNKYKDISRAFFWTSTVWMGKFLYITFTSKNSGKVAYPGTFKFGFAIRCIKK